MQFNTLGYLKVSETGNTKLFKFKDGSEKKDSLLKDKEMENQDI